jgi:hypothetical protein
MFLDDADEVAIILDRLLQSGVQVRLQCLVDQDNVALRRSGAFNVCVCASNASGDAALR